MASPLEGFYHPPEWATHEATWLSWPHNLETWPPHLLKNARDKYAEFVKYIAKGEHVHINVVDQPMLDNAATLLDRTGVNMEHVTFHHFPTNDAWIRDHGPDFLVHPDGRKQLLNWTYNAWGGKYPPYDLDNDIPLKIAAYLDLPVSTIPFVLEGGALEFDGSGTLMTTTSCLLHPNRNPGYSQAHITSMLKKYYNVTRVLWLDEGIVGDDTDGHIDDISRFVNDETIVTVVEHDKNDENYMPLKLNKALLESFETLEGKPYNIEELPMPKPFYIDGLRLPASYANFYIANSAVIVPVFGDPADQHAIDVLGALFPDREVTGVYSGDIVFGLGSFHCLSKQEPVTAK